MDSKWLRMKSDMQRSIKNGDLINGEPVIGDCRAQVIDSGKTKSVRKIEFGKYRKLSTKNS